eukprot:1157291-Pelagomonas_calceolata.AAC.1
MTKDVLLRNDFSATPPVCAGVLEELRDKKVIGGWRNELYPVTSSFYDKPELLVSRLVLFKWKPCILFIFPDGCVAGNTKTLQPFFVDMEI